MKNELNLQEQQKQSLNIPVVRQSKIKVIHGTFVEEPKCKICETDISHEWLDGDYSLLMCDKKECWDELNKRHERL